MSRLFTISMTAMLIVLMGGNLAGMPVSAHLEVEGMTGTTQRISISSDGWQGNLSSFAPAISADGRYVAFVSQSINLVRGDTNESTDVFVHDRLTGQTTRASLASDGSEGNGNSEMPSISADGRYVGFSSDSTDLVAGDMNDSTDVFVHDRQTGQTSRISLTSDGSEGNSDSWGPFISADGRYVTFSSASTNLVDGDTHTCYSRQYIYNCTDVFVHDRVTGETIMVSVASDGTKGNWNSYASSISENGQFVVFNSEASNLVAGDTNICYPSGITSFGCPDVFVHDRSNGQTTRISVASDGTQGGGPSYGGSISANGRYIAFTSYNSFAVASGGINVFLHDRLTGETTLVSLSSTGTAGNDVSWYPSISADGRHVAFDSRSTNLVDGDSNNARDIFVRDVETGETTRVSLDSHGKEGDADSFSPSISADGRYVAFGSIATNLVLGDMNDTADIFVRDREGLAAGYSISGHVTNADGDPLPNVSITAGYGINAITDSQGDFSLTGLESGTYWITASMPGYTFTPISRQTSVPPMRTEVNFTVGDLTFLPFTGR